MADLIAPEVVVADLKAFAAGDFGAPGDRAFEVARLIESQGAAIERVRNLHRRVPVAYEEFAVCSSCEASTWPCATVLALDAVSDPQRRNGE